MAEHRNSGNRAVRRILREVKEFAADDNTSYTAAPLEDDLFEWHFTIRGPRDSEFEGGIYHGRIILPPDYPMKPPDIVMLTPNGRFKVGQKICLTISGHHPEHWQPAWSIRTALLAIISFLPTPANGALGAIEQPKEVRRELAQKSHSWSCTRCGSHNASALPREDHTANADKGTDVADTKDGDTDSSRPANASAGVSASGSGSLTESNSGVAGASAPAQREGGEQARVIVNEEEVWQQEQRREEEAFGADADAGQAERLPVGGLQNAQALPAAVHGELPAAVHGALPAAVHGAPPAWPVAGMPPGMPPMVGGARVLYNGMAGGHAGMMMQQMHGAAAGMANQAGYRGPVRRRVVRAQVRIPLGSFDLLISLLVVFIAALLLRKFYFAPSLQ